MKFREALVPVDFTGGDVEEIVTKEWGHPITPPETLSKMATSMSKLQVPLHYEQWEFSDFDLLRIVLALKCHPNEAQEFVASVYQLIKEELIKEE